MGVEHEVNFQFKARYHKLTNPDSNAGVIWFVLHGYGQLSPYFIDKFEVLVDLGHSVIAPEGLNRFYLEGFQGRVGAAWMTKEGRETDITNYVRYLDCVYSREIAHGSSSQIYILGFSQGAATCSRWVTQSDISFDRLILWAGIFPPDMKHDISREKLSKKEIYLVYGSRDKFVSSQKLQEQHDIASQLGVSPEVIIFDGTHDIDKETLLRIAENKL